MNNQKNMKNIFCVFLLLFLGVIFFPVAVFALNNAQFISQTVPKDLVAGQRYNVSITMKNTGDTTWTESDKYRLGSQNPQDNLIWGIGRINLFAGESIAPMQTKTFNFDIKAPAMTGDYNFQWRMLQEGVQWFGQKTTDSVKISVALNQVCAPNIISGCKSCKSDGLGWVDIDSRCLNSQVCQNGICVDKISLDSRLGVTHMAGKYPVGNTDFLVEGARDAYSLGFRNIEILLSQEVCSTTERMPLGPYHTQEWCSGGYMDSLKSLASHPKYQQLFNMPFDVFFLTTTGMVAGSANQWGIHWDKSKVPPRFTENQLNKLYHDYFNLTEYLLLSYKNTGKTFIIQSNNEMDWLLISSSSPSDNANPVAIQNAIDYWNTIQKAVNDAKSASQISGVSVYHACEVNLVQRAMNGQALAANSVVPLTKCDLYGYSAYDTFLKGDDVIFRNALNYLASQAPDSPDFGSKNIYISEMGVNSRERGEGVAVELLSKGVNTALSWGVPYILHWQMYDNECDVYNPTNAQCRGFWIRKPSGDISPMYSQVYSKYPSVFLSGRVAKNDGTPLPGVVIDLCNNKFAITDHEGKWQKNFSPGMSYCARIKFGLPAGYTDIKAIGNNLCYSNSSTYEWQVAGKISFISCAAANEGSWDLLSDSNINFEVFYPSSCTPKTCSQLSYSCGSVDDGCGKTIDCGICPSGQTCSAGKCVTNCTGRAAKKCDSGNLYWYNSCGQKEELAQNCGKDELTDNYQCSSAWIQRQTTKRGCANNVCYQNIEWSNTQNCAASGQVCANGACAATCSPSCAGKICGDDGCGGTCGACSGGKICRQGECVSSTIVDPEPKKEMTRSEILAKIAEIRKMLIQLIIQLIAELQKQIAPAS